MVLGPGLLNRRELLCQMPPRGAATSTLQMARRSQESRFRSAANPGRPAVTQERGHRHSTRCSQLGFIGCLAWHCYMGTTATPGLDPGLGWALQGHGSYQGEECQEEGREWWPSGTSC